MVTGLGMNIDLRTSHLMDIGAVSTAKTGRYLFLLRWGNEVDHIVFEACRKGWIIDSAEKYSFLLPEISLFLCAGVRTRRTCLFEVRELFHLALDDED